MINKSTTQTTSWHWPKWLKGLRYFSLSLITIFLIIQSSLGQSLTPFANLVFLGHACNTGGEVIFELNGNEEDYTYYWEHGPTDLHLTGLESGIYTLIVRNKYGCIETYPVEILSKLDCDVIITASYIGKCDVKIDVLVLNENTGEEIDPASIQITWNGVEGGHSNTYKVSQTVTQTICVEVTVFGGDDIICCDYEECITIDPNKECKCTKCPKAIVNEIDLGNEKHGQFIELLVLGNGECGQTIDLRGMILDDNNGSMVSTRQSIVEHNRKKIGIDDGFIEFGHLDNWKAVPQGSLIVIYEPNKEMIKGFPMDDPTDENKDGVFILPIDSKNMFYSKSSSWNQQTMEASYSGGYMETNWSTVSADKYIDGIQLRTKEGDFQHGLSYGKSQLTSTSSFEIWLTQFQRGDNNCQLELSDFLNPLHFSCFSERESKASPGLPNSFENRALIQSLKNCENVNTITDDMIHGKNASVLISMYSSEATMKIYPNPSRAIFHIDLISNLAGKVILRLIDLKGQLIVQKKLTAGKGYNQYPIELQDNIISGMYLLELELSDGQKLHEPVSIIR